MDVIFALGSGICSAFRSIANGSMAYSFPLAFDSKLFQNVFSDFTFKFFLCTVDPDTSKPKAFCSIEKISQPEQPSNFQQTEKQSIFW